MLSLLAGLALFLFGVRLAGENLQSLLGPGMRRLLAQATRTPVGAALVGTLVTAAAQSGTLVTLLTVQFVNAGILGLRQALAIALGAGVGGTLTVQLLALHITDLKTPLLALGLLLSTPRLLGGRVGRAAVGFGLLFLGLEMLLAALEPLENNRLARELLTALAGTPLIAAVIGAALSLLLQSSNAVATLVLAFVAGGLLSLEQGAALVIGANVGTTVTAVSASAQGSVDGRRAAVGHLALKVLGALVALVFIGPLTGAVAAISDAPLHFVANLHTLFNLLVLLASLPLDRWTTWALRRAIPTPPSEDGPRYLRAEALEEPELAYGLAFRETVRIAEEVERIFDLAVRSVRGQDLRQDIQRQEDNVDDLTGAVVLYLGRLGGRLEGGRLAALLGIVSELEALADLSKRLSRQPLKLLAHGRRFSAEGGQELGALAAQLQERMRRVSTALSLRRAPEDALGEFSLEIVRHRMLHLERLAQNLDSQQSSSVHLDVLTILEQLQAGLSRIIRLIPRL
nr:Na/Pi symporter [Deinobacterium chartae]